MTIIRPTTINARFSQPVGLGGEKLWLCPTLCGDRLDLSGNGNHGTYDGGMGTVADKYKGDRAFDFDGVNDYISTGRNVSQTNTQTFSAWSYLDTQASQTFISSCYTSGGSTSQIKVALGVNSSSQPYAVIQNTSAIANAQSSTVLPISQWFHVCGVFIDDGGVKYAKLFVNGNLDTTASGTGSFPILDDTLVGVTKRSNGAAIALINGLQDDIRVFSRALTPSEIKHLASRRGILGSPRQPYDPLKRTVVRVPAAIPAATVVGSIKKPKTIIKPSYQAGYARNASESENPELFDGLRLCWSASMGVTGEKLQTVIGSTDGTISGGSSSELWKRRKGLLCLDFDGVNDEAFIGGSERYRLGSIFTMSIWWRTDQATLSTLNPIISSAGYYTLGTGAFIFRPSSTTNIQFASYLLGGSNLQYLSACPVPSIGYGWHHTVLFCDGNNLRVQHDGKQLSSSVAHTNPINDLESGLRLSDDHSNNKINGSIAETAFWSRELSVSERMKLWKLKPSAWLRRKQRVSVAVPAGITFKPYWAKQSTQVSGLLK